MRVGTRNNGGGPKSRAYRQGEKLGKRYAKVGWSMLTLEKSVWDGKCILDDKTEYFEIIMLPDVPATLFRNLTIRHIVEASGKIPLSRIKIPQELRDTVDIVLWDREHCKFCQVDCCTHEDSLGYHVCDECWSRYVCLSPEKRIEAPEPLRSRGAMNFIIC